MKINHLIRKKLMPIAMSCALAGTAALAGVGTGGIIPSHGATDRFTDIAGHWGQSIINEAASLGVVGGYPEGNFLPDNLMKREEFFKLITNVLTEKPDTSATKISFSDVDPAEWYVPTIKTAVAAGITQGYQDGTFGIGQMISRQEAAKVVATVVDTSNLDTTKTASTARDAATIGEWALPYVNIMFQKGYMRGDNEGNFRPTMALTRAEAATLLLNVKKLEKVIKGPAQSAVNQPAEEVVTVPVGDAGCQSAHKVEDGAFTLGTGTLSDPYQIYTAAQLNHMRVHMADGAYYILKTDIRVDKDFTAGAKQSVAKQADWTDGNFAPIGDEENAFKGVLDGNGHSIKGLKIIGTMAASKETDNVASYGGLFGNLAEGSVVKNLTIDDSSVNTAAYTGLIAGYCLGDVLDCTVSSSCTITGQSSTGGLVGYSKGRMSGDTNLGSVNGQYTATGGVVGTMAGKSDALYSCINRGKVSGKTRVGGVAGYVPTLTESITVKSCTNHGEVSSSSDLAGGVLGLVDGTAYGAYVKDCVNKGTVSGTGTLGGVVAGTKGEKARVTDCQNKGEVRGTYSGGVVGSNEGEVSRCANFADVVANTEAGGIVGYQNAGTGKIDKCYNDGTITANSNAGGLAGLSRDKVQNSYNTGKIKATDSAGGLVGENFQTIKQCYNVGIVDGTSFSGGLTGRNRGKLTNCFYLEGTSSQDIGNAESGSSKSQVLKLTEEQLSGQEKVKLDGWVLLTKYLNDKAGDKVWVYTYPMTYSADEDSTTQLTDGGGIVPPISISSENEQGNVIDKDKAAGAYLYPQLVDNQR